MVHLVRLRRYSAALLAVLLSLIFSCTILSCLAFADEYEAPSKREALEYSAELLKGVALSDNYQKSFGVPDLDFETLTLSDPIPVYKTDAGSIAVIDENYWLVYQNKTAVATLISYTNETGTLYRLTSLYSLELDRAIQTNESSVLGEGGDEPLIYFKGGIIRPLGIEQSSLNYAQLLENMADIKSSSEPSKSHESLRKDLIPFDNSPCYRINSAEAVEKQANEKNGKDIQVLTTKTNKGLGEHSYSATSNAKAATVTSKLPVPKKIQTSNTCWATSVSSIGEFLTGTQLSNVQICKKLGVSLDSGGKDQNALDALRLFTYPKSSTSIHGKTIAAAPSDQQIKNWIDNGLPIYAHLQYSPTALGHAVVVCGWGRTGNSSMYIYVMNPGTGKEEVLIKPSSGFFQFFYAQKTYMWSRTSIVFTEWQKPYNANGWCYMNANGARTTGWKKDGNTWYYFNSSGLMQTGWQKVNGKWYYMNSSGAMQTGWKKIGGKWFYLGTDGAAAVGWKKIDGHWYAFGSDCAMRKGWFKEDSKWYYLRTAANTPVGGLEGSMLSSGAWKIGNKTYIFDAKGVCANP